MSLPEKFRENIKQQNLFNGKDKLLLAVSGGVDSVVLCELCKQSGFDFAIAHCNFQLRGEESERDEQFVRNLGEKYAVKVEIKRFDTQGYAEKNKLSIQEAARNLRYEWFKQLTEDGSLTVSASYVLTAHHSDDNIETLLMNFFRGTGLHGLTGIPVIGEYFNSRFVRRPLLIFTKEELIRFAQEQNLEYVEDSSNQSSKYTRNYFRNEIIPAIVKVYPQVRQNLTDNIERFKEIERLYQFSITEIKKKLCKQKGDEIHIPIKQFIGYGNRALIYEIIAGHGFSEKQVDEVIKLAKADSGSYINSSTGHSRIIRHRHWLIITTQLSPLAENIIIECAPSQVDFSDGSLRVETTDDKHPVTSNKTACVDAKLIHFPLLLRKWKPGDYFYPLGMRKKKKLARFFIDQKLSKTAKEKVWVIEMNKKIVWIVGFRIDDRFKIMPSTKEVLQITYKAGDQQ